MADDITVKSGNPAAGAGQQAAKGSSASQAGAQGAQKGGSASKTFSLIDEADQAAAQTAAPPDKYAIPASVKEKFPDLVELIKATESMNDDERNYWFQILPLMTDPQIEKFRAILVNEKQQLQRLDKEYEEELTKLNEKHLIEWKEFESKEKRKALKGAEKQHEAQEKEEEEALLQRLSQV